ncbi:hypothetical protein [Micropruina sp.]|uniref:hypothetical protein n=1 Tax=Micropruina sp. TaxID=2737536 RepID=UPI0039E2B3E1
MTDYVDKVGIRVFADTRDADRDVKKLTAKRRRTVIEAVLDDAVAKRALKRIHDHPEVVEVTARVEKARAKLEALKRDIQKDADATVSVNADIKTARAKLAQLRADLASTDDKAAKVKIRADIKDAMAGIKQLQAHLAGIQDHKAQITVEAKQASKELGNLEKERTAKIQAKVESVAAKLELARVARDRIVNLIVKVRSSAAAAQIRSLVAGLSGLNMLRGWGQSLSNLGANLPQIAMKIAMIGSAMAALVSVGFNAAGAVAALGSSLASIGPMALVGVAGIGAAVSIIGTLIAAFRGVGAAVSAAGKSMGGGGGGGGSIGQSAQEAAQKAQQLVQAQRALRNAHEQAAQAARNLKAAQRDLKDAEQSLADAQKRSVEAQKALSKAREDARRTIRDLANDLTDAKLDQTQAAFDLADAEKAYADAVRQGADPQKLARLQLELEKAQQAYKKSGEAVEDAGKKSDEANRKGIDGSDEVTDAQKRIADAAREVRDAQRGVAEAHQRVADAQRGVRDAAEAVADAQANLRIANMKTAQSAGAAGGGVNAFADAMKKLPPNAQEAVRALLRLGAQLEGVRRIIQQRFFEGFAAHLDRLSAVIIPQMRAGLGNLAGALGAFTNAGMDALTKSLAGGVLQRMFDLTAQSVRNATEGLRSFIDGLVRIGEAGATFLPAIGDRLAELGKQFGEWASNADLAGMMREAAAQAGHLWSVVKNLGGIIGGVFKAMDTGRSAGLASLADTLGRIRDIVNSPSFQKAMGIVFTGAAVGAAALAKALNPIGKALEDLSPLLGDILATLGGAAASALTGIVEALAQPVAQDGLSAALAALGEMIKNIPWMALGQAVGVLGQAIAQIAPLVTTLLNAVAPLLPPILAAVAMLIPPLVRLVQAVLPPLVTIIQALIPVIEALAPVIDALTPFIAELAGFLADLLEPALKVIAWVIENVVAPAIKFIGNLIDGWIKMVGALMSGQWVKAWTIARETMAKAGEAIRGLIVRMVANALGAILKWAVDMGAKVKSMWNDTVAKVKTGAGQVVDWVKGIPGRIKSALGGLGNLLLGAGQSIMNGFLEGLQRSWRYVTDFVGGIADWIARNKGPLEYDYRLLQPAGKKMMAGLKDSMAEGFRDVQGLVSGFAPRISADLTTDVSAGGRQGDGMVQLNFNVESMSVRNDSDLRRISTGLADVVASRGRAAGNLGLVVTGA